MDTGLDFLVREALAALGPERLTVVERDLRVALRLREAFPDARVLHAARAEPGAGDLVVLPVAKQRLALFRELERLAGLVGPEGRLAVYGSRKEGVGPAQDLLAAHCALAPPLSRGGGRLLLASPRPGGGPWGLELPPPDYRAAARGVEVRVAAWPGLFSWDRLDPATALLLESARPREGDRLLDLGCGAGVVAAALLAEGRIGAATLTDCDALALEASAETLHLNGLSGEILAADAGEGLPARAYDLILSNPPLHRGFASDRDALARMVENARPLLAPRGRFFVVGPPTLGLERLLEEHFGAAELVAEAPGHGVWRSLSPRRSERRRARRDEEGLESP